jgi:hypothetical protein
MPPSLNLQALDEACRTFARRALAEATLVDVAAVDKLAKRCVDVAVELATVALEARRDPNLVTRAVRYLCTCDTLPPAAGTALKFYEMLGVLIELACPTPEIAKANAAFFDDIQLGFHNAT